MVCFAAVVTASRLAAVRALVVHMQTAWTIDVVSWSESLLHIAKSFIQITLNRKVIILITGSNKAGVSFNNIAGLSPVYSIATIGATAY